MRLLVPAVVLLLATPPTRGQTLEQKKETIAYLRKLYHKEGGFAPSANAAKAGLRATSSALRALKYFGGASPDPAADAAFVKGCFDKASGGFADAPGGKPDVALTAVGLMALVELKQPTADYESPALKYFAEHVKTFEDVRIAVAGLEAVGAKPPASVNWGAVVRERPRDPMAAARDAGGATV